MKRAFFTPCKIGLANFESSWLKTYALMPYLSKSRLLKVQDSKTYVFMPHDLVQDSPNWKYLTPKVLGVFFIKTASKQPLFKAR
jgi:hypothetical protein